MNIHWKDWCWSWSSSTLATSCKELTHWKRPWCWERLRAGGDGDYRGWGGWIASTTQWTWVWASSGRWWRTGKPGMLQSMGSQRVKHDLVTEQTVQELKHVRKEWEVEAQNLVLCFSVFTRFIFAILLFLIVGVIQSPKYAETSWKCFERAAK